MGSDFSFSFCAHKRKRKTAGCRSRAKKSSISLNEKNSLRSNKLQLKPQGLFISLPEQRNEAKKFAGCRSEAKIFTLSLKKKNSLRSNSFFFLTVKSKNFFTLLHGGRKQTKNTANKLRAKQREHPHPTNEAMLRQKKIKVRPHFFTVKRRCFSER